MTKIGYMHLLFLNMFHLQTDRNGVHQKGHWGYCNADEEEEGDCPIPKTEKPSPKPPTTTTLKPKRRKPSTPKPQTKKPTTHTSPKTKGTLVLNS
jgi:hypothetical protein